MPPKRALYSRGCNALPARRPVSSRAAAKQATRKLSSGSEQPRPDLPKPSIPQSRKRKQRRIVQSEDEDDNEVEGSEEEQDDDSAPCLVPGLPIVKQTQYFLEATTDLDMAAMKKVICLHL